MKKDFLVNYQCRKFLWLLTIVLVLPVFVIAQESESQRILTKSSWRNEPLKIERIKIKSGEIETGKGFFAGEEWYNGLTITARNISTKPISRIEYRLSFPPAGGFSETVPSYSVNLVYGRDPSSEEAKKIKLIMPGESVEVRLLDANLPYIKAALKDVGIPEPVWQAEIQLDSVTYDDGKMWANDMIFHPDPKNPLQKVDPKLSEEDIKRIKESQPPQEVSCNIEKKPDVNPFQKISFRPAGQTLNLERRRFFFEMLSAGKQIGTARCNARWTYEQRTECGGGNGCRVITNYFEMNNLRTYNTRRLQDIQLCSKDDGTVCNTIRVSIFTRNACGARVACGEVELTGVGDPQPLLPFCDFGLDPDCCPISPILIDIAGNGYNLTNAVNGVMFDFNGDTVPHRTSWTSAGSDDAWLALDRNSNGQIDSALELFGNFTSQPTPPVGEKKNGFLALKEYDKPANGGNNDNQIDARDAVFSQLKLWTDTNHNGISEAAELQNLSASAVRVLELNYRESRRVDEHGNRFKYRAIVRDARGAQVGRWAWDVFLVLAP